MTRLDSIDLTQGKRFERILDEEQSKKLYINTNSRGIHRLKKGEIPHVSLSNTKIETVTTTTSISDWVISIDEDISNNITWNNNIVVSDIPTITTTSTNDIFSWNISGITIDTDNIEITSNTLNNLYQWYNHSNNTYTYYYNSLGTNLKDKSISERIKFDPFGGTLDITSNGIISRIKESLNKGVSSIKSDIYNRLLKYDNKSLKEFDISYHNSILYRLMNNDDNDIYSSIDNFDDYRKNDYERNLKRKAPFIKRVYVTNRGRSFDSTELRFDMVLAKEHFEEALQKMIS